VGKIAAVCAHSARERAFVQDLRVRCQAAVVLLALTAMVGCGALDSNQRAQTPGLVVSNPNLDFGPVVVGGSKVVAENILNSTPSSVTINQVIVSGSSFHLDGASFPLTLGSNQSATFSVRFIPKTSGNPSGSLAISSTASAPITVALVGQSVSAGQLSVSPSPIGFGNVLLGKSQTQLATLTNSGGSDLTISQLTVSGSEFQVSGVTLPFTLPANQSTNFNVTFTPNASGSQSGMISMTTSASLVASQRGRRSNPSALTSVSFPMNRRSASPQDSGSTDPQTVTIPLTGAGAMSGQLTLTPSSVSFGSLQVGSSQTVSQILTNSGSSSVTVSQASMTGTGFSINGLPLPLTLGPGQSQTFSLTFAPTSAGSAVGNLAIASNASNPTLAVPLSGTGVTPGSLTATASSLSFGGVQVGHSQTLSETLTNSGGSSLSVTQANVTGTGFSVTGLSLPLTLVAGQSFTFGAVFTPTSAGSVSGKIAVVSNGSNPNLAISMSGSGALTGQLTVSPALLSFGSVVVGQSKSLTATLNATGSSVTISSVATGTSEFVLSGQSFPLSIAAGSSATITVTFTPQASGTASDSASFTSNAANTPVEALTGNGTAPPQHSVDLTWNPSPSAVNGYNIYRSGTSGGPYSQINSTIDSATSYIDNTVAAGNTYFYVTTAVDANGVESVNSNQVKTAIPTP
jgi:hypothetical protein